MACEHDLVLVVDYGAQYAQLIARRVREANVYSEIVPHTMGAGEMLARRPAAIILSGGPSSVYEAGAPQLDPRLLGAGVPIFGICYGFMAMAQALGGRVARTGQREYGRTTVDVVDPGTLLAGLPEHLGCWMSHSDEVTDAPEGFIVTARSAGSTVAAFEDVPRRLAGVQWHPEVVHSEYGQQILEHFLFQIAGCRPTWTMSNIVETRVAEIREQIGGDRAICGLSGGVDSAVAAGLVHEAIGDRLTCVFVDHGLLRQGEREQVEGDFVTMTGISLRVVDAADRFFKVLEGVIDPEAKRKAIGREFIRCFEEAQREIVAAAPQGTPVRFLVQGTLYPDVVESGGGDGAAVIKSHHNVGGLPDDLQFELCEPLRDLFKDEVRQVAQQLGLPVDLVNRHPFPGPGLAIRIIGEVTPERVRIVRHADDIVSQEIAAEGLQRTFWQFPVVLLADVHSVGVQGDERTYGHPIVLRPVTSEDGMTADWARIPYETLDRISTRIVNEIPEVNRVVLDVTTKPPATIEWE